MSAYLKIEEAAQILGLSRQRVYQLALSEHRIPFVRIGRSVRIPRTAWDEWMRGQHTAALASIDPDLVQQECTGVA